MGPPFPHVIFKTLLMCKRQVSPLLLPLCLFFTASCLQYCSIQYTAQITSPKSNLLVCYWRKLLEYVIGGLVYYLSWPFDMSEVGEDHHYEAAVAIHILWAFLLHHSSPNCLLCDEGEKVHLLFPWIKLTKLFHVKCEPGKAVSEFCCYNHYSSASWVVEDSRPGNTQQRTKRC